MEKYLKRCLPYFLILIISIIPSIVLCNKGFIAGHDNDFHFAQIKDLFDSLKNKNFNYYINFECNHFLGMGVKLMYAPLSHFFVVIIAFVLSPFGISLTQAMKLTIYLSILFSGIFTYHLGLKMTNNKIAALIAASIYMLFPYRYTDIYIRNAFAETIAMAFIPLVFNGTYSILKMKKIELKPFFITICGVVLVFMTHNITAIYTFSFVFIFALFYIKDIIRLIKDKYFWVAAIVSIIIMVLLVSPLLFPMLEHRALGIYRIFDAKSMNTNIDNVTGEIERSIAFLYAGVNDIFDLYLYWFIAISITLFTAIYCIKSYLLNKNKYYFIGIALGGCSSICLLILTICLYNFSLAFYLAFLLELLILFIPLKKEKQKFEINLIIAITFLLIFSFTLTMNKSLWKIMPKFFYTIQFAWRLWVFVGFFLGLLACLLFNILRYKRNDIFVKAVGAIFASASIMIIRPLNSSAYETSSDIQIDIEDTYYVYSAGWQLEYFPKIFLEGPKSDFWWRWYNTIYKKNDEKILMAGIKDGKATITNYQYNTDSITFHMEATELSTIEIPRIYYLGYQITINSNDEITNLDYFCSEGYVGFKTDKSGDVTIKYVGTKLSRMAKYTFSLGVILLVGIPVVFTIKKKKENE